MKLLTKDSWLKREFGVQFPVANFEVFKKRVVPEEKIKLSAQANHWAVYIPD